MIQVDHDQAGRKLRPPGPFHLDLESPLHVSEVVQIRKRIDEGKFLEFAALLTQERNFFNQGALF